MSRSDLGFFACHRGLRRGRPGGSDPLAAGGLQRASGAQARAAEAERPPRGGGRSAGRRAPRSTSVPEPGTRVGAGHALSPDVTHSVLVVLVLEEGGPAAESISAKGLAGCRFFARPGLGCHLNVALSPAEIEPCGSARQLEYAEWSGGCVQPIIRTQHSLGVNQECAERSGSSLRIAS